MLLLNYSTLIDPVLRDLRVYIPEFSGMKAGDRVLDVGCGTGAQALHYAKKGITTIGTDIDSNMIKVAERNQRKLGLRNVSFQIADASSLPFQDDLFDYASISLTLHTIERTARDKVISEMKRVVKKGGALIFADYQVPLPKNGYRYLIKAIELIVGGEHYRNFRDFIAQGGLEELLTRNQLQIEKRGYLKAGVIAVMKTQNTEIPV